MSKVESGTEQKAKEAACPPNCSHCFAQFFSEIGLAPPSKKALSSLTVTVTNPPAKPDPIATGGAV